MDTASNGNEGSLVTHILIVDDSEPDRQLLKTLLEFNGYRVTVAGDGVEALAAAHACPPDAIISDVAMPKMDGFVLCHTWMQDAELKAIPFIFYSANLTLAQDAHVSRVLGAARYLVKPMQQEGFLQELRSVLLQQDARSRLRT
jgi:CheY-like chemotaxis protein